MSRPVYSTLFIAGNSVSLNASYVVPAGEVAVVRDIDLFFEGSPGDTAVVAYDVSSEVYFWYHLQTAANEWAGWRGRQVFGAGAEFSIISSGPNTVMARVCGYLLTDS